MVKVERRGCPEKHFLKELLNNPEHIVNFANLRFFSRSGVLPTHLLSMDAAMLLQLYVVLEGGPVKIV